MTYAAERPDDALDPRGEDALLLREFAHRTANEISAAYAALHLAKRSVSGAGRRLMEEAAGRLQAFGRLHSLLARPVPRRLDVASDLSAVCRAIVAGVPGAAGSLVSIDVGETWVEGLTARRLVLIGAELVTNAVRHALDGRSGRLEVSLRIVADDIVLEVRDDGCGMRPGSTTSGTGYGSGIVAELVERARGRMSIDTGPTGTTVRVALPIQDEKADDYPF